MILEFHNYKQQKVRASKEHPLWYTSKISSVFSTITVKIIKQWCANLED